MAVRNASIIFRLLETMYMNINHSEKVMLVRQSPIDVEKHGPHTLSRVDDLCPTSTPTPDRKNLLPYGYLKSRKLPNFNSLPWHLFCDWLVLRVTCRPSRRRKFHTPLTHFVYDGQKTCISLPENKTSAVFVKTSIPEMDLHRWSYH